MKKIFNLATVLLSGFLLLQCSTEEPQPLTEDLTTTATSYADQFFTIGVTITDPGENDAPEVLDFRLAGNGGKVSVNWGDGRIEKLNIPPGGVDLQHYYERYKNYSIKVSGDILTITSYKAYSIHRLNDIHFGGLVNLKEVDMNLVGNTPEIINLSRNRALETVDLFHASRMKDLLLPTTNNITYLSVGGDNQLSTAVIDRIVGRVYGSVRDSDSPRTGYISIKKSWYDDVQGVEDMAGPPSGYTITKLKKLRDTYGWTVSPIF